MIKEPKYRLKELKVSTNRKKKFMAIFSKVGTNQTKTIHFGGKGYMDYPTYYAEKGEDYADKMKFGYIQRHSATAEDWTEPVSAGTLSRYILWNKPTLAESIKDYKKKFGL